MTTTLAEEVRARRGRPDPATARDIRLAAGVSQERLAHAVGVTRITIARWEDGSRQPRGRYLDDYLRVLGELKAVA